MKTTIITIATTLFLATAAMAQTGVKAATEKATKVEMKDQDEKKKEITAEKLPMGVQKALKGEAFKGWSVSNAYEVSMGSKKMYEVVLSNGEKEATYKFDKDGNTLG